MNSLLIKLSNIMVLIAGVSLVFYLFGTLLPIIPEFSTVDANWGLITSYKNFWGVYYEGQGTWVKDILLTRNIGIFAEGPMFSYCLVIALYIQIFLNRETKISQVAVLALAIVTTFSYCGIMCMIVTFMFKYIRDNMQSKAKMSKMVLFLPIICLLVLVSFDWLVNDKLNSISGSTRLDDLEAGFMAWKDSPIWGQGYNEGEAINAYKGFWRDEHSGYSNAIMKILAECGIVFSLLYIIPFISALLNIRKNYSFFVGAIVMLLLLFTTVVPYKLITVLLVVSGWRCMFYAEKRFIKKCLVETPKDVLVKPL